MAMKKALALLCLFVPLAFSLHAEQGVRLMAGGKTREAQVLERQGKKGLFFYGESLWQALFFDQESFLAFEESGKKYQVQFEKKKLKKRLGSKAFVPYKKAPALLEWGSKKEGLDRFSQVQISFGYRFYGGSPYFCVEIPGAQNQGPFEAALANFAGESLLFTRSQLERALLLLGKSHFQSCL